MTDAANARRERMGVWSRDANDLAESSAKTFEKRHERSIEFWNRTPSSKTTRVAIA